MQMLIKMSPGFPNVNTTRFLSYLPPVLPCFLPAPRGAGEIANSKIIRKYKESNVPWKREAKLVNTT